LSPKDVVDTDPEGLNAGPVPRAANKAGSTNVTVKAERKDPCASGNPVKKVPLSFIVP